MKCGERGNFRLAAGWKRVTGHGAEMPPSSIPSSDEANPGTLPCTLLRVCAGSGLIVTDAVRFAASFDM